MDFPTSQQGPVGGIRCGKWTYTIGPRNGRRRGYSLRTGVPLGLLRQTTIHQQAQIHRDQLWRRCDWSCPRECKSSDGDLHCYTLGPGLEPTLGTGSGPGVLLSQPSGPECGQSLSRQRPIHQRQDLHSTTHQRRCSTTRRLTQTSISRLYSNERSLTTKKKLEAFNVVLRKYLTLGHAHIIPQQELLLGAPCYYMPVHGVFKDTSTTTKIRPVFDASAKTNSGYTLNDTLHVGPNLYPPLVDILIKFRKHTVGISADLSKMFREILLNKDYRNLHRFLLCQPSGQIVDCRMERVTFGVASSPFLATQILCYLA